MSGMSATTGIGSASVTHQVIISPPTANTFAAPCSTLKGLTKYKIRATTSPASNEINLRFCFEIAANVGGLLFQDTKKSLPYESEATSAEAQSEIRFIS